MTDISIHGDKNDVTDYTTPSLSPPLPIDFEIHCKPEPCSSILNSTNEDPSEFVDLSTLHIPISIPAITNPIVLLERCDNIWKTLQLIKVVQTKKPAEINDDTEEDKEEKVQHSNKIKHHVSYRRQNQSTLRSYNTASIPFKFSVQRTKRVYPCTTCGKQYMEMRSLRNHTERVHGIIIPYVRRKGVKKNSHLSNKKDIDNGNPVTLLNKESNNFENPNNDKDPHGKITAKTKLVNTETVASRPTVRKFVKCTLCQQKVISLRKHLIHYHKIGGSSSVVEQLQSSLLIENGASSKDKNATLEDISSKKSPQSANNKMNTQDGFRIMDNEADTRKTSQVKRKRKYTFSYTNAKKRSKLSQKKNNEYVFTRHKPAVTQEHASVNDTSYKCDICLGIYASDRSLYKHQRNHIFRGETKENFHNVKCRYLNSPFNKNYKLLQSSTSSHTTTNNINNSVNKDLQLNNSKRKTFKRNRKVSKINQALYNRKTDNNEFICVCGRLFRNPHTLFIHKQSCELFKQEDTTSQHATSINSDSGSGISITIKKLNNSYEIVGKDNNENKFKKSEIYFKENNLSTFNRFDRTKESVNLFTKRGEGPDNSGLFNYSKDHSFLKLHVTDEDVIIDVEDDEQIEFDKNNTSKQIITQDDKRYMLKEQDNIQNLRNEQVLDKNRTLKQMCQNVLENNSLKNNQFEDQEIHQEDVKIKRRKIHQENKRKLRSSNKRCRNTEKKFDNLNDKTEVCMTKFDPLSLCGYCNEEFQTINSYHNHQCIVKVGKPFDEFSLELLCFYCGDVLTNFNEYDKHIRVKHFGNAYHCYLCIEEFLNDKARLQHIHLEHNNMSCRFCNEKISFRVKALHEGYHLGFGFPCHKCKKSYTNEKNLSYHNYKIHPKTDYQKTCTICLKTVKIRGLRIHMATHKLNSCYFCGKLFSNRTGLEFHTMMHHGTQSKLKCNVCGTRFFTKKQLEKHANVDGCNSGMQGMKNGNIAAYY
ncbi:zinc finger protein 347-like isoform X2 [Nylanderia fulva]|nr:zinc finger protein 347-like isoform X2 [Nylanderia fulva]XP_029159306.1 zinc finger protein 347-like isoform X2 [Nylanderia fulva]